MALKVINFHQRILSRPKAELVELLQTLASKEDRMLAINADVL